MGNIHSVIVQLQPHLVGLRTLAFDAVKDHTELNNGDVEDNTGKYRILKQRLEAAKEELDAALAIISPKTDETGSGSD